MRIDGSFPSLFRFFPPLSRHPESVDILFFSFFFIPSKLRRPRLILDGPDIRYSGPCIPDDGQEGPPFFLPDVRAFMHLSSLFLFRECMPARLHVSILS